MLAGDNRVRLLYAILIGIGAWFIGSVILGVLGFTGEDDTPIWEFYAFIVVLWLGEISASFFWGYRGVRSQRFDISGGRTVGGGWSLKNISEELGIRFGRWDILLGVVIGALLQFPILPLLYLPLYPR